MDVFVYEKPRLLLKALRTFRDLFVTYFKALPCHLETANIPEFVSSTNPQLPFFESACVSIRIRAGDSSWRCLEVPGSGNVLGAFCLFDQVEPDPHVALLGKPGFTNQLGMDSGSPSYLPQADLAQIPSWSAP